MLLDAPDFFRRTLSVLSRLVHDGGGQQLRRIELAHGKSVEPSLLPARQTLQLSPSNVPQLDVDALRPTLAEQKHRHRGSVAAGRRKSKTILSTGCRTRSRVS